MTPWHSGDAATEKSYTRGLVSDREKGRICPHCKGKLVIGGEMAVCHKCGTAHHFLCWRAKESCGNCVGSPSIQKARNPFRYSDDDVLKITAEDLKQATPLPMPRSVTVFHPNPIRARTTRPTTNRLAFSSFLCALAGIPFFGLLTGLVAVFLGLLALSANRDGHEKGIGYAVAGIILGLIDFVAWFLFISVSLSNLKGQLP